MSNKDLNIELRVKKLRRESIESFSIVFEKPRGFTFEPGNWMDIRFPVPEFPVGKTYSFASSPTEADLMITFKKGVSKFKKTLENVKPGEIMLITQYGSNGFILDKRFKSVFIAGGIGITPFRSMLKEAVDYNEKFSITLIYSNNSEDFPFRKELEEWQRMYSHFKLIFIPTRKDGRLTKEKLLKHLQFNGVEIVSSKYYIAGSPGMVNHVETMLISIGIGQVNIMTDSFTGY